MILQNAQSVNIYIMHLLTSGIGFVILALFGIALLYPRANFTASKCLLSQAKIKEHLVKLKQIPPKSTAEHPSYIWKKLAHEISVFNNLCIIMQCRKGVPILYSSWLRKLIENPCVKIKSEDGFERLMYLYAAANLFTASQDELIKRQLLKNCIYVFGVKLLQPFYSEKKFAAKISKVSPQLYVTKQPYFKYLGGGGFSKFVRCDNNDKDNNRRFANSYIIEKTHGGAVIKNYADKILPAECYEISGKHRFEYNFGADKMQFNISHTSDTFYAAIGGSATAIYLSDAKVNFENSLTEKTKDLKLYININDGGKIFIIRGKTKTEINSVIAEIKKQNGNLNYLFSDHEIETNRKIETLYSQSYFSACAEGEKLKDRYAQTCKIIPTLHLPTIVYDIAEPDEFFALLDSFDYFKRIARTGTNINIAVMYSSQNDIIREHIAAFADRDDARGLISCGVFLFFVDKVKSPANVIYFLSKMAEAQSKTPLRAPISIGKHISVEFTVTKTLPVTHSAVVNNTSPESQKAAVIMPFDLGSAHILTAKSHVSVMTQNMTTGRTALYKIPKGARIVDETFRPLPLNNREKITRAFYVCADLKMNAFEEKILEVRKNENIMTPKQRKSAFIGAISNIVINSANKKLCAVFNLPLGQDSDENFLTLLKSAIKNYNPALFFSLLDNLKLLPADVYSFIIEKVIGLRLQRGRVILKPNVSITGGFELTFDYSGVTYRFNVKEKAGGFSILYDGMNYTNYVQVGV